MTNKDWGPPPFPTEYLIGILKKDYNEGMLMEQWVGPDDKNSSLNIIQVRPMLDVLFRTSAVAERALIRPSHSWTR